MFRRFIIAHNMSIMFALILAVAATDPASSICAPFPCEDCWIRSAGQLNLVVMDREQGQVRIVPNLRFQGESEQFALVVPTPALPQLEVVPADIWDEAFELTAPASRRRDSDASPLSCSNEDILASPGTLPETDDVIIHGQQALGGFEATIISSDDPEALVDWLQENGFVIEDADAAKFEPFVQRDWFFTAMKPDTTDPRNQMPAIGWDNNVDPIMFTYEDDGFELPVQLLSINRAASFPVVLYVVDDHRTTLAGFTTNYANDINTREYEEISRLHPALAGFLGAGRFLTRLDKTYTLSTPMDESVFLERAPSDEEFRRTRGVILGSIPLELVLLSIPLIQMRARRRKGRKV